jgi:hypothetical protein
MGFRVILAPVANSNSLAPSRGLVAQTPPSVSAISSLTELPLKELLPAGWLTSYLTVPSLLITSPAVEAGAKEIITPEALLAEVNSAADPKKGRGFGEKGNKECVEYVAQEYKKAGLKPFFRTGFKQEVRVLPFTDFAFAGRSLEHIWRYLKGDNVIGYIPGSDPKMAKQTVILSAHLDAIHSTHDWLAWLPAYLEYRGFPWATLVNALGPWGMLLGYPVHDFFMRDFAVNLLLTQRFHPVPGPKKTFPGAEDNASGTAALLTIARLYGYLAERGIRPKRSIIFAALNGEENGMEGSRHLKKALSPEQNENIVQVINMDMVGRNNPRDPNRLEVAAARTVPLPVDLSLALFLGPILPHWVSPTLPQNPVLQRKLEAVNQRFSLGFRFSYTNNSNRSDQEPFRKTSIAGLEDGTPGPYHNERDRVRDRKTGDFLITPHYLARVACLVAYLTWDLGNTDILPHYHKLPLELPHLHRPRKTPKSVEAKIFRYDLIRTYKEVRIIQDAMTKDPDFKTNARYKRLMVHQIGSLLKASRFDVHHLESLNLPRGEFATVVQDYRDWAKDQSRFNQDVMQKDAQLQDRKIKMMMEKQRESLEKSIKKYRTELQAKGAFTTATPY